METIQILRIPFAKITQKEAIDKLEEFLCEPTNHVIVTPNPEGVMQARRNPYFYEALKSADLSLADGTGIVLASYLQKERLPERVRGVDTIFALLESLSEKRNFTAYFLGGTEGTAEKAKENMQKKYSRLKVAGFHHGFFSAEEEKKIIDEINHLSPDILLVCTGMPRAEIWVAKNKKINARLTMCLGGTLDVMAGTAKTAPPLMRKFGLEWLYRLIRQPSRFKRMLDIPRFVVAAISERVSTNNMNNYKND
ncbi:MAG: WecB/TagA/CpsF family glycosyltransferase [Defluviitaleaceae bacterium]|nr:WecB/TagA/CpsF family glycosyltransferase [Defluviitaleaceae bacterium]